MLTKKELLFNFSHLNTKLLTLGIIIFLAYLLRIIFLIEIPPGLANDELNIILNAQSLLNTGQFIPGVITGLFGTSGGNLSGGIHSELSSYLLIPSIALFGLNIFSVKLPFILSSLGLICLSYLIVKSIANSEAGLFAAILSAVNPWSIFFARSAYESIFSAFFYLLAIFLLISLKKWRILWATPFFVIGFLSYFSAKTLLIPIIAISSIGIKFLKPKESIRPLFVLSSILILFVVIYGVLLINQPAGTRLQELKNKSVKSIVDSKRTASLDLPFNSIFENKFIEDFKIRLKASIGGFSPSFLFLDGQPESIPSLSIPDHGPLYLIDFPLVILGIIFLATQSRKYLFFLLGLVAATLTPNLLNLAGTTYMIRTVVLFPLLTLISALGLYYFKTILFKNYLGKMVFLILIICYLFSFGNFTYQYFGRLPVDRNEGFFLHQRILVRYIKSSLEENISSKVVVITPEPKHLFYRYLFFTNNYREAKDIQLINSQLVSEDYSLKGLTIINYCPNFENENSTSYVVDVTMNCPEIKGDSIASIKDGGEKYIIVNGKMCNSLITRSYPLVKDIKLLSIENILIKDFCQNFVIRQDNF